MSPASERWIYLIRHGETPENASRVVQTPEAALSPQGVEQAERLRSDSPGTRSRASWRAI